MNSPTLKAFNIKSFFQSSDICAENVICIHIPHITATYGRTDVLYNLNAIFHFIYS
jgi:hypothetical protein